MDARATRFRGHRNRNRNCHRHLSYTPLTTPAGPLWTTALKHFALILWVYT